LMMTTPKKRKTAHQRTIEDGGKIEGGCVLRMGANFDTNKSKYRLLEATPEILKALTSGERVYFKGDESSEAVMCTANQTFKIQKVETSNTMLLVPPGEMSVNLSPPPSSLQAAVGIDLEDVSSPFSSSSPAPAAAPSSSAPSCRVLPRFEADGAASFTFVTEVIAPKLSELHALLSKVPYGACTGDSGVTNSLEDLEARRGVAQALGRPSLQDLVQSVQASEGEIRAAMRKCQALEIDGRWCSVDPAQVEETLEAVVDCVIEHDLNPYALGLQLSHVTALVAPADGSGLFDARVVRHCLALFSQEQEQDDGGCKDGNGGDEVFALDRDKVAVFRAHSLFKHEGTAAEGGGGGRGGGGGGQCCLGYDELMEKWELALPMEPGVAFDRNNFARLLKGVAVALPSSKQESELVVGDTVTVCAQQPSESVVFRYLPEKALSTDPVERFASLFEVCPQWTGEALSPYLEPLVAPGVSVASLLLRHTRSITAKTTKVPPAGGGTGVSSSSSPVFCAR